MAKAKLIGKIIDKVGRKLTGIKRSKKSGKLFKGGGKKPIKSLKQKQAAKSIKRAGVAGVVGAAGGATTAAVGGGVAK